MRMRNVTYMFSQKTYRILLFILLSWIVISPSFLHAKKPKSEIDSLKVVIPTLEPLERFESMAMLIKKLKNRYPKEAVEYASQALELSRILPYDTLEIRAIQYIGEATFRSGEIFRARQYFEDGLALAQKIDHKKYIAFLENSLGLVYLDQGDYEKSLRLLHNSLDYWNAHGGKPSRIIPISNNIATVYKKMKQYDEALSIYNQVLPIAEQSGSLYLKTVLNHNIGNLYLDTKQYEKALPFFRQALKIGEKPKYKVFTIGFFINIGRLFTQQGQLDSAITYYDKSLQLANEIKNPYHIQAVHRGLGDFYHKTGQYEKAIESFRKSLRGAIKSQKTATIAEIQREMSDVFYADGQSDSAFYYLKSHLELRDTLYNEDLKHQIAEMNAIFSDKERDMEYREMQNQTRFRKAQVIFSGVASLLLILGLIVLFVRFREKKAANVLLESQNDAIEVQNQLLTQSNSDLRQFAYVASHDLREPVRTIRSYLQLLQKRLGADLTEKGKEYIDFAIDGALRMDRLLRELLLYSRIGRENIPYESIDLNEVIDHVKNNLHQQIEENEAIILADHLPMIKAQHVRMIQLFQNLISNSIKFRGEETPLIRISYSSTATHHQISIKDNGIGIEGQFQEKVFTIFQRLHTQEEYEGTGIGLALSKRIVEQHGGDIWFESENGLGTNFHLTMAKIPSVQKV